MVDTADGPTHVTVEAIGEPAPPVDEVDEGADATDPGMRGPAEVDPDASGTEAADPGTSAPGPSDAPEAHRPATCPVAWCPICLAVTAVQPVKPEVVEHLLKAGAEFFLAMRSLIDARADELADTPDDGSDHDFHKIDIG